MKPLIQFLSQEEIQHLHQSALQILEEIGMRLPHPEALERLEAAGARIVDTDVVRMPPSLVARALETVPKRDAVTLYGRDPAHDVTFRGHEPALACMTMAVNVIDPHTRERRPATDEDLAALTRIADRLENIRVNGGLITPQEVPSAFNDWYTWATTIKNTTKHITGGVLGARCVRDAAEMGAIAVGGMDAFRKRPFISGWVLTLPPLGIDTESLDALMEMSRWNIPSIISSGPILGTSSPVTIAGTVAQAHAEILGAIVVTQLVNPGAPMVYTSFARGVDMRSGNISMACPEFGILKVAMSQMGRFLDLPIRMPSMLRDAKVLDAQAGYETGMIGTVTGLAADLMDSMQLDMDMVVDFPDLIYCNEAMAGIKRMAREVVVDGDRLALDAIRDVGPGGNFLAHKHTYQNFKQELWMPALFERRNWDAWEKNGALTVFAAAEKKVLAMLAEPVEPLLSAEAAAAIDAVVENARAEAHDD